MNSSLTTSNVYYLPARTTVEPPRRQTPRATFWSRATRAWWRLRFTAAELWSVARRGSRDLLVDDDSILMYRIAEERSRPRYAVPARVIDFEAARQRLRA